MSDRRRLLAHRRASGIVVPPVVVPPPPPVLGSWKSGVYRGYVDTARKTELADYAVWRGEPLGYAADFGSSSTWAAIEGSDTAQMNRLGELRATGLQVDYALPMLPAVNATDGTTTLTAGAAGSYTARFTTRAQALLSRGLGDIVIRLGWEMNSASGFRWALNGNSGGGNPAAGAGNKAQGVTEYIAYWRLIVNAMRAIAPNLKFCFCPINGWDGTGPTPGSMYPGDAWVDLIAVDLYDQDFTRYPPATSATRAAAWNAYKTGSHGLDFWLDKARTAGKGFGLGEWGVNKRFGTPERGGLDNPDFIDNIWSYINAAAASGVDVFEIHFDFSAPDGDHRLYTKAGQAASIFPLSAARYQALRWGGV